MFLATIFIVMIMILISLISIASPFLKLGWAILKRLLSIGFRVFLILGMGTMIIVAMIVENYS